MLVKDWMQEAANEIRGEWTDPLTPERLRDVIRKHCPFKEGVAYVEQDDAEDETKLRERLADLLHRTAIALKGPEPPLTSWSWHDLPELAAALVAVKQQTTREPPPFIGDNWNLPREPKDWVWHASEIIAARANEGRITEPLTGAMIEKIIREHMPTPREPPLLMCVDCKNTESCAGAMARGFNHGRCMHCGGYFKVVRA